MLLLTTIHGQTHTAERKQVWKELSTKVTHDQGTNTLPNVSEVKAKHCKTLKKSNKTAPRVAPSAVTTRVGLDDSLIGEPRHCIKRVRALACPSLPHAPSSKVTGHKTSKVTTHTQPSKQALFQTPSFAGELASVNRDTVQFVRSLQFAESVSGPG